MKRTYLLFGFVPLLIILFSSCRKNESDNIHDKISITSFEPSKGAEGSIITFKGKKFGNSANEFKLFFNGKEALISTFTDTFVTAAVPHGATTGKISVSSKGNSATSTNDFTILKGIWVRKKDLPLIIPPPYIPASYLTGRIYTAAFAIGDKAYAGAGLSPDGNGAGPFLKDWHQYDPAADQWTRKSDFPIANGLIVGVSFAINNKGYVGIGQSNCTPCYLSWTREFWEYDPSTDQWTKKADLPTNWWKKAGIGFGVGNKGYAGLGQTWDSTGGIVRKDWWEYDQQINQWIRKADHPGAVQLSPAGFVANNKIYLGLGTPSSDRSWWEYDPSTDIWTRKSDYPGTFMSGAASGGFTIGNKGYISVLSEFWEYDPSNDKWTEVAFFDNYRVASIAFSIGDKGYLTTGGGMMFSNTYAARNDLWQFTPPN